ncbi:hypothetical protein LfeInf_041 [Lactobacillus phage LfeInf]|uniref:Uncharacterized protein n=1 Tax=Lactobacillus phage LfeInf TaxID=1567484 RepID=A0A0A7NU04_9CAUD|nr:hypothetical protein AXJ15_gp121 [Lactobacillus phage LfeInf]AIZ94667.1 hypothetical protein LfeInf_041 [Lactobacillus phage LfeInf]
MIDNKDNQIERKIDYMKEEDKFNYDLINLTTSVIVGSLVSLLLVALFLG